MPASLLARLLTALALTAALTGCVTSTTGELADPVPAPGVEAPAPEAPVPGLPTAEPTTDPIVVDWGAREQLEPTTLVDGRTVQPCLGDAPLLCVLDRDGTQVGMIELSTYPAEAMDVDVDTWLRRRVAIFVDTMRQDRRDGCGADHQLDLVDAPVTREVDGHPALTYRYTVTRRGRELERGVTTLIRRGDEVHAISAIAYDPAGCIGTEGGEFTPAGLETFEGTLDAIVRGSRLP